jgi:hypothetical protein
MQHEKLDMENMSSYRYTVLLEVKACYSIVLYKLQIKHHHPVSFWVFKAATFYKISPLISV